MGADRGGEVLVVGAGIGGLTAALALAARGLAVRVLEAGEHPGGKAGIVDIDGVTVETDAGPFTADRAMSDTRRTGRSNTREPAPRSFTRMVWSLSRSSTRACSMAPYSGRSPLGRSTCVISSYTNGLCTPCRLRAFTRCPR